MEVVGASTLQGVRAKCGGIAGVWDVAEATLRSQGGNGGRPLPCHDYIAKPARKLQALIAKDISKVSSAALLNGFSDEDATDAQSNGGIGAGLSSCHQLRGSLSFLRTTSSSCFVTACSCPSAPSVPAANTVGPMAGSAVHLSTGVVDMRLHVG